MALTLAATAACHRDHSSISGPADDPPVTSSPNKTPKYKVGDALNIQPADNSMFMFARAGNGSACFVDWRQAQFVIGSAAPIKFTRSQAAPPGYNRCAISPNKKFGMFQDRENRAKACNLSNGACWLAPVTDDATRVLEIWMSDSTYVLTDGVGGVIIVKYASAGNMLSAPVVLTKFVSTSRVISVTGVEGGKYLAMATSNGCYETRSNDGKYQTIGQVVCGQIAKSNQPVQFAWTDAMNGRMYGVVDSDFLMFSSSNGQLTQLGPAHHFDGPLYMPAIINGDLFVSTTPGVVEMYTASNPEWGKPQETFTFKSPDYYELGAIPCPDDPADVCLTTKQSVFRLEHTKK